MDKNKLLHNLLALLKAGQKDDAKALSEAAAKHAADDPALLSMIGSIFLRQGESSIAAKYLNQSLEVRKKQYEPVEDLLTNEDIEYLEEQENELKEEEYSFIDDYPFAQDIELTTNIDSLLDDIPVFTKLHAPATSIAHKPITPDPSKGLDEISPTNTRTVTSDPESESEIETRPDISEPNNSPHLNSRSNIITARKTSDDSQHSDTPKPSLTEEKIPSRLTLSLKSSNNQESKKESKPSSETSLIVNVIRRRRPFFRSSLNTEISEGSEKNKSTATLKVDIDSALPRITTESPHTLAQQEEEINHTYENRLNDDIDEVIDDISYDDINSDEMLFNEVSYQEEVDEEEVDEEEVDEEFIEEQSILENLKNIESDFTNESELNIRIQNDFEDLKSQFPKDGEIVKQDINEGDFSDDFLESLEESVAIEDIPISDQRLTRRERAQQVAINIIDYAEWTASALNQVTDIFEEYGWSHAKTSIITAIDNGASLEHIVAARDLRHYWKDNERFWMTFSGISSFTMNTRAAYQNLSWPMALALVTYNTHLISDAEIERYLDEEFEYWYSHPLLSQQFPAFLKYLFFRKTDLAFSDMANYGEYGTGTLATYDELDDTEYRKPITHQVLYLESMGVCMATKSTFKPVFHSLKIPYKLLGAR